MRPRTAWLLSLLVVGGIEAAACSGGSHGGGPGGGGSPTPTPPPAHSLTFKLDGMKRDLSTSALASTFQPNTSSVVTGSNPVAQESVRITYRFGILGQCTAGQCNSYVFYDSPSFPNSLVSFDWAFDFTSDGDPGLVVATFHGTLTDSAGGVHPVSEGQMNVPYPGP